MIRIRPTNTDGKWQVITPTIFPDGASQIWKIELIKNISYTVKWNFEFESELIHVLQLKDLIKKINPDNFIYLDIPYLPYGRQDKEISVNSTFALHTFLEIISSNFYAIHIYDVHNPETLSEWQYVNKRANHVLDVLKNSKTDIIMFPDEGALKRYTNMFKDNVTFLQYPKIYGKKVRDQKTGEILSYEIIDELKNSKNRNILIVDDICDGGATFIQATKELKELGASKVNLCVSHGIFSKGKNVLHEAGISNIYTTNSLIKNKDGYEV